MGKIADRIAAKQSGYVVPKAKPMTVQVTPKTDIEQVKRKAPHHLYVDDYNVQECFNRWKYVIATHPDVGEVAFCFPCGFMHSEIARQMFPGMQIVAAGFYCIEGGDTLTAVTYGKSESLGIGGRPIDAQVINKSIGLEVL